MPCWARRSRWRRCWQQARQPSGCSSRTARVARADISAAAGPIGTFETPLPGLFGLFLVCQTAAHLGLLVLGTHGSTTGSLALHVGLAMLGALVLWLGQQWFGRQVRSACGADRPACRHAPCTASCLACPARASPPGAGAATRSAPAARPRPFPRADTSVLTTTPRAGSWPTFSSAPKGDLCACVRRAAAVVALSGLAVLVLAPSAFAHARMSPAVSLAGKLQLYSLAIPTEKEGLTTTKIVLTVPSGFGIDSFVPAPGWTRQVKSTGSGDSAIVQTVTWTGGAHADRGGLAVPVPRPAGAHRHVHVPGEADLLRRLDRRLVRLRVVRRLRRRPSRPCRPWAAGAPRP